MNGFFGHDDPAPSEAGAEPAVEDAAAGAPNVDPAPSETAEPAAGDSAADAGPVDDEAPSETVEADPAPSETVEVAAAEEFVDPHVTGVYDFREGEGNPVHDASLTAATDLRAGVRGAAGHDDPPA